MPSFTFILLCVQACLLQSVISQLNRGAGIGTSGRYGGKGGLEGTGTGGIGGQIGENGSRIGIIGGAISGIGSSVRGGTGIGSGSIGGISGTNVIIDSTSGYSMYGGYGAGNVAVLGDLPVAGTTVINGQVPVMGAVTFNGNLPAAGSVSVSGTCGCPCGFSYINN